MTTPPCPVITAFRWVPDFAQGLVRDLRVRWACEEIGQPYDVELLDAFHPRDPAYLARQPFDQVPAFADSGVQMFETGAILLRLGERDARLLPSGEQERWSAISWLFAALNSVEPHIMRIVSYDLFNADATWMPPAREAGATMLRQKLGRVSDALSGREWLAGPFSIADIAMVTMLDNLRHTSIVAEFPQLAEYKARGEARPAHARAMAAQIADYSNPPADD